MQLEETTCYKHKDRVTGVSCQRCERYICSSCMHQASVGSHCPECVSRGKQKVYTRNNMPGSQGLVTNVLIALNAAAFAAQMMFYGADITSAGNSEANRWGVHAGLVDFDNQWDRLLTSGFVHVGLLHVAVNMFSLYRIGPVLERRLGSTTFAFAYLASIFGSSFAVVAFTPNQLAMGASGGIYGLAGLLIMWYRSQGISLQQSGMMDVIMLNVFINLSGFVSVSGHAGGLVIGLGLGALYFGTSRGAAVVLDGYKKAAAATAAVAILVFVLGVVVAEQSSPFF